MNFRHFKTLKEAKAYIASRPNYERLYYRKKKGKHKKPYIVGTHLSFLNFM